MHSKVSQRLTNLVEAHRIASEEFWLPLSNFQSDLIALRRSMDALITGGASGHPLEPSTYITQTEVLQDMEKQLEDFHGRLNVLKGVGDKIIDLLIDEKRRSEGEKSILKNEVNSAIREVSSLVRNIQAVCDQQRTAVGGHLLTAQNLQVKPKEQSLTIVNFFHLYLK